MPKDGPNTPEEFREEVKKLVTKKIKELQKKKREDGEGTAKDKTS